MRELSYPKNKINVLLLEKVDKVAFDLFEEEGYNVESLDGSLKRSQEVNCLSGT